MGTISKIGRLVAKYAPEGLLALAVVNFAAFGFVAERIGGDAVSGKREGGHYFLGNHGTYTEVSVWVYIYSKLHLIASVGLCAAAVAIVIASHVLRRQRAEDKKKRKSP